MRELVYHVAMSVDGFIAREDGTVGEFTPTSGPHVDDYLQQLQNYDTVLMGRATYEFGYDHGLEPGRAPYPHMRNYVFSRSLELPEERDPNLFLERGDVQERVRALKAEDGTPIYLCGGGRFAGSLLEAGLVDRLLLKINPMLLGNGIGLGGLLPLHRPLELNSVKRYDNGVQLVEYGVAAVG